MRVPASPPNFESVSHKMMKDPKKAGLLFTQQLDGVSTGPYEHWEKVRFKPAIPSLTPEETWVVMKFKRMTARRLLNFEDTRRHSFYYTQIGDFQRALHEIDSNPRGIIGMSGAAATSE